MREKVINTARALGLQVQVKRLEDSTATVEDAARAVSCAPAQIAKSLVFVADGDPVVCIASGAHRVSPERLAEIFDVAEVRAATPQEVRAATGFSVGGVPPFGHGLPVVLDEELLDHEMVWAAGGDGHSLFQIAPRQLADCTQAIVAPVGA
ncbi:MAG TPA: YbaK/EbsC family protein [Thermoleophilaceae bacterium]|nr:YbaK/EbsC family protein [Thermoleophilaceae bacterium]